MCFADSPSGALLAAFNFWAEGTLNRPAQVFERYAADTPAKAIDRQRQRNAAGFEGPGPIQIVGYEYSTSRPVARVSGCSSRAKGGCVGDPADALARRHWKYVIPPSGTPAMKTVGSCSGSGYLQWGGVQ